jgi:ribonuclease-3
MRMKLSTIAEIFHIGDLFRRNPPDLPEQVRRDRKDQIADLLARAPFEITGMSDASYSLYDRALTHRSYAASGKYQAQGSLEDNERLEFLGNYILDYLIAEHLYIHYRLPPGEMNRRLQVTRNSHLADIVQRRGLGIEGAIRRKGQALTDSIIADAFEALIAAIYLDRGPDKAREVVLAVFAEEIEDLDTGRNYRGRLQEMIAQKNLGVLEYEYRQSGPVNDPLWTARVKIAGTLLGEGRDSTKQGAAMQAAREALDRCQGQGVER